MRDIKQTLLRFRSQFSRRSLGFLSLAAASGVAASASGCISDPDCGICDPENLVVEIMSGPNYIGDQIWILSPECVGPECPTETLTKADYFVNEVITCEETDAANRDTVSRTPEEYCKISPIVVLGGEYQLEFIFNNLLDPESIELVRRLIDDPNRLEVYDWKNRIANIEGPISRFNGDYANGGTNEGITTRSVNLSCVERLSANGTLDKPYNEKIAEDPFLCDTVDDVAGVPTPRKLQSGDMPAFDGLTSDLGFSCSNPLTDGAVDNCCSYTDWVLSTQVAKYGVTEEDNPDTARDLAAAITCDPAGDVYTECRDFIPYVNRSGDPTSYDYDFNGDGVVEADERGFPVPRYDMLRSLHPDDRPKDANGKPLYEQRNTPCTTDSDCGAPQVGAACVGFDANGLACAPDTAGCSDLRCTQEWFVTCDDDPNTTGGGNGYCKDKRFKDRAAGACYRTTVAFTATEDDDDMTQTPYEAGSVFGACDSDRNGIMTAEECCLPELGYVPGEPCDPIYSQLANLEPLPIYERDRALPAEARCYCTEYEPGNTCSDLVAKFCAPPLGTGPVAENTYIQRPVSRVGGVIYDPAVKGLAYRPADLGNYSRARIESSAAAVTPIGRIGRTSIIDGWQMSESGRGAVENRNNYDMAMCSGQEYRMVFEVNEGEQVLRDKVGNTLANKNIYVFETPQFHVDITSRSPLNNKSIGACESFSIGFSNKYDLDPENLGKLQLWSINYTPGEDPRCTQPNDIEDSNPACFSFDSLVAGGEGCTPDDVGAVDSGTARPCLKINTYFARAGSVGFKVDDDIFGPRLFSEAAGGSGWYRLVVPGLHPYDANGIPLQEEGWESLDDLWGDASLSEDEKQAIYRSAFKDACGMPLVTAGLRDADARPDFWYDIKIDAATCEDDQDYDGIEGSCDNASDFFNPLQRDADLDGIGDINDKCVLTAADKNTADIDGDGIGDACDSCSRSIDEYNKEGEVDAFDVGNFYMRVRNVPLQQDSDQDGIGDACDNCPSVANCESFGPVADGLTPWTLNTPINALDDDVCQVDKVDAMGMNGANLVGDACDGTQPNPNAAAAIGLGPLDDFDQDGLLNEDDACPRFPLANPVACTSDADCGEGSVCETGTGVCDHRDDDADGVGNICDSCPSTPNPNQVTSGSEDDPDGDFVGSACETDLKEVINPRPYSFREVSAFGRCCSLTYLGDGVYVPDPDFTYGNADPFVCVSPENGGTTNGIMCSPEGVPVQQNCENPPEVGVAPVPDGVTCLPVPTNALSRVGVVTLPPGCDEALAAAGITAEENVRLGLDDFDGDVVAMWSKQCFDPQWDQDYDGVGDAGAALDLCPFHYDPENRPFIDETGAISLMVGAVCPSSPQYLNETLRCIARDIEGGGGGDGEDGGDTTGG